MSIDAKLKSEGFELVKHIPDENLYKELPFIAMDYRCGVYTEVRIIPSDIARAGCDWIPVESSHLLYVKLSDIEKQRMEEEKAFFLVHATCKHKETEETSSIILNKNNF